METLGPAHCIPCLTLPAPVFLTELQNQEVQDGYPVSFDCVVTGQPVPTVCWFKDGRMLEEDDHYMISEDQQGGHQLIITAVVPADMGVYRCMAENSMGVSSTKAELRVDRECGSPQRALVSGRTGCGASYLVAGVGAETLSPWEVPRLGRGLGQFGGVWHTWAVTYGTTRNMYLVLFRVPSTQFLNPWKFPE